MSVPLRLLIVEDSEDDLELMLLALERAEFSLTHERVQTAAELWAALSRSSWDVVLSDYTLPELSAPAALSIVREVDPDLPFVVISGTIGEEMASDLLRIGASDYVLKRSLVRLESIIKREVQATEHRRAHRAAEAAAQQLAAIVQSSNDAIIGKTLDGIISSWNPAAERLYGWLAAEAVGQSITLIIPPDRVSEFTAIMARLQAGQAVPWLETERRCKDGTRVPVALTISVIRDSAGRPTGASAIARDLSATRRAEALLARDALILGNVQDSVIVTDLQGVVTYWNEGATRLFGWTAEEMLGRLLMDRYPAPVRDWIAQEIRSRAAGAEWSGEFEDFRKDGSRVWIDARVTRLHDAAGEPVGILGISHDITERKQAEEAERQREADYRALAENLPQLVWTTDAAGETQYLNPRWVEFTGLELESTRRWGWANAIHPDDLPHSLAIWRTALRTGAGYETEFRLRRRDGQYRWHRTHGVPVRDGGGAIVRWIGTCMNVEEQKQELLAQAELAAIVECSDDMIISTTPEGLIRTWNPGAERALGYTAEEMIGRSISELAPLDVEPSPNANLARVLQGETLSNIITTRIRKDGSARQFSLTASPIRNAEGHVVATAGISRDITEQQRAAAALRDSEERFRAFMDNCPAAAFIKDEEGRLLYVNGAWRCQFEPEPVEWEGMTEFDFWPAETAAVFRASDMQCLAEGKPLQIEEAGLLPGGGETRHWLVLKFPLGEPGERRIGGMAWDVTDRKRAEGALHLRDRAIRAVTQGILITDPSQPDNPIVYASPGFERLTGYASTEVLGRNCRFLQGGNTDPEAVARIRAAIEADQPCTVELLNFRKDGTPFWNELSVSPVRDQAGRTTHFVGVITDVTDRRQLEEQLRQAQKMEGIGQLAGGIAHDFNNMLAVINGYSELLLLSLPPGNSLRRYVEEVGKAGERAAGLTRQLLAFSRRQILEPKVLDLNQVVLGLDKMLRRLIGEDLELVTLGDPEPVWVKADPGQLGQLLVNLTVNARDAMPTGGTLTLSTRNVLLDDLSLAALPSEAKPGPYVRLSVKDTGTGISPEALPHIFEPFFTTKGIGKGTGLGLSTVYGIVRQSGGFLQVETAPGQGTTFAVYLPRVDAPATVGDQFLAPVLPSGTETLLVVEDEPMVRAFMVDMLRRSGYIVLEALQGDDALRIVDEYEEMIHLLLTDVVMPRMSGPALAEAVLARRPETAVLFVSGYTDDAVLRHGVLTQEVELLQKPFGMRDLAERVRRLLDQRQARAGRGTILVVDDVAAERESLAEVLRKEGYVVLTAGGGSEALALLQQEPKPGLIFFELMMPGMNGWVFRHEQRKDPGLRDIPAVALSGRVDPGAAGEYLEVAATLQKPVDIAKLLEIAGRYLPFNHDR